MSTQVAFRMFLNPGQAAAYKRRHDEIWPELVQLLKAHGMADYSIYLDEPRGVLFAVLKQACVQDDNLPALSADPVMRRWWLHMADLMQTNPDGSPVAEPLPCLFHLP